MVRLGPTARRACGTRFISRKAASSSGMCSIVQLLKTWSKVLSANGNLPASPSCRCATEPRPSLRIRSRPRFKFAALDVDAERARAALGQFDRKEPVARTDVERDVARLDVDAARKHVARFDPALHERQAEHAQVEVFQPRKRVGIVPKLGNIHLGRTHRIAFLQGFEEGVGGRHSIPRRSTRHYIGSETSCAATCSVMRYRSNAVIPARRRLPANGTLSDSERWSQCRVQEAWRARGIRDRPRTPGRCDRRAARKPAQPVSGRRPESSSSYSRAARRRPSVQASRCGSFTSRTAP